MTRIFTTLAWFAVLFMAATLFMGLMMGDLRHDPSPETISWARVHRLCGVAAALFVVFVNSIVVTYFIGTSRWCKEVVETYRLDANLTARSTALKRRAFPWAVMSMLTVVGVISLGGAADPATGRAGTEDWVVVHLVGALLGLVLVVWAAIVEWNYIRANHVVINEIVAEVKRVRDELGLEVPN